MVSILSLSVCLCGELCCECVSAEGGVVGEEWSERCRHLAQCLSIATATGFHTVYTHIEQVYIHVMYMYVYICGV